MAIQFWMIAGLVAGCLVSIMLGWDNGVVGEITLGIIGGLVGSLLAVLLFLVSGTTQPNLIFALIAFTIAVILLVVKHVVFASRFTVGVPGYIILGVIGGLVGGALASTLFVVSDSPNQINLLGIVVVFGTVTLITFIRRWARTLPT